MLTFLPQGELRCLIERIERENGKPFDIQPALVESTGNNISSLVSGGRLGADGDLQRRVCQTMTAIFKENEKLIKFFLMPFVSKVTEAMVRSNWERFHPLRNTIIRKKARLPMENTQAFSTDSDQARDWRREKNQKACAELLENSARRHREPQNRFRQG